MKSIIKMCILTVLIFICFIQTSYGGPKTDAVNRSTIGSLNRQAIETEKDVSGFCRGNYYGRFTHSSNTGSTITCSDKNGKLIVDGNLQWTFYKGLIQESLYILNDLTYHTKFVRDVQLRVSSIKITDGRNNITILTENGYPQNFHFDDCYLPILNETASMSDPNGKGLGLSSTKITELLNIIYREFPDDPAQPITGTANSILRSASFRELLIEKIREKLAKENKSTTKSKKQKKKQKNSTD